MERDTTMERLPETYASGDAVLVTVSLPVSAALPSTTLPSSPMTRAAPSSSTAEAAEEVADMVVSKVDKTVLTATDPVRVW